MAPPPPLAVASCPSQDVALLNVVAMHPTDAAAVGAGSVELHPYAFQVMPHEGVARGTVGLNAIQRRCVGVSTGDPVAVVPFRTPPNCKMVNFAVEIAFAKRTAAGVTEVDAAKLAALITQRFRDQVFGEDQQFTFEFLGNNYVGRVTEVDTEQDALDAANGAPAKPASGMPKRGLLATDTAVSFEVAAAANANIKIKGGARGAGGGGKQVFRKKELDFQKLGIGGLEEQFESIFRRAFSSRVLSPDLVRRLGVKHVKGMLLYGPPGTGKTLIARQIGKMLNGSEPKICNGPEVLNKYVGASEENIRNLFADAEADQKANGDAADLHVIIFDEIDAICKSRGSVRDGSGVHDTIVNQLLTKIDGVDALDNILLIGMTNRKDMLDEALLRPGRLEVHIEISLPDENGRHQILKIHTSRMSENSFLGNDVDLKDLAARTKNYSGAELEGLTKAAASYAFRRQLDASNLSKAVNEEDIKVTGADFEQALSEVKSAFGASQIEELDAYVPHGVLSYGGAFDQIHDTLSMLTNRLAGDTSASGPKTSLLSCLLEGPAGSGKTALACTVAKACDYPFVKFISADNMVGFSESMKMSHIAKVFEDAYKSPLSLVILDEIERLIEYVSIGPRFSNGVLQALLVLAKRPPPKGHRLFILGTTSLPQEALSALEIYNAFQVPLYVPSLRQSDISNVIGQLKCFTRDAGDAAKAVELIGEAGLPVKRLFLLLDMASEEDGAAAGEVGSGSGTTTPLQGKEVNLARFMECLTDLHKV